MPLHNLYLSMTTSSNSFFNGYYGKLEVLLAAQDWQKADQETLRIMKQFSNNGYLTESAINTFPCAVLSTINKLWTHYSKGHFGFSVQKECYLSCLAEQHLDDLDNDAHARYLYFRPPGAWGAFGKLVGWSNEESLGTGLYGEEKYWLWDSPKDPYQYNCNWYDNLTFNLNAPSGHLPILCGHIWENLELINQDLAVGYDLDYIRGACFFIRLETCNISSSDLLE